MSKTDDSLDRLVCSGRCDCIDAGEYREKLRQLGSTEGDKEQAKLRSKVFKALGDETRQRIIAVLLIREMCVCEIMTAFDMTQPTTSHHLKILEDADLIMSRKEGKWVFYRVQDQPRITSLLTLVSTRYPRS